MNPFLKTNLLKQTLTVFLTLTISLSGCSTIAGRQNGTDTIHIDANESSVEVVCSGQRIFSPGNIQLERSENHACAAQLKGFERYEFQIKSKTGWKGFGASTGANFYFGLFTLGGGLVLGWLIDWPSGAMRNLKPNYYYLEMKPLGTTSPSKQALEKVGDVIKTTVALPTELVKETSKAILDTTVQGSAEKMGFVKKDDES